MTSTRFQTGILLAFLLLFSAPLYGATSSDQPGQPVRTGKALNSGYQFQGHYYALASQDLSWTDSENEAVKRGGHLASVNSQEEQDFLNQSFTSSYFWIGLTDQANEGEFVWVNGEPLTYTNWDVNQPDNGGDEDFVGMNFGPDGAWNDFSSDWILPGILEFEWFNLVAAHSKKCLDVAGVSAADGATIYQWECLGTAQANQTWSLDPVEDNGTVWYQVKARHSGKCLEVEGSSQEALADIIQMPCTQADNQLFRLDPVDFEGEQWNSIVAKHSGQCLDVEQQGQGNGSNVLQYPCHGQANQLWRPQESARPANLAPFTPAQWSRSIVVQAAEGDPNPENSPNFNPPRIEIGDSLFVDWQVINTGDTPSGSFVTRLTIDGQVMADLPLQAGPGKNVGVTDFELDSLPPGFHLLTVTIDPDNEIPESNENDNIIFGSVTIGGPEYLHLPQYGAGLGLTSDVVITNRSPIVSARGSVTFFDPEGKAVDPQDLLSQEPTFDLPPLGSTTLRLTSSAVGDVVTGSAVVSSDRPVSAVVRFALPGTGIAGVGSAESSTSSVVPVRRVGGLETGVAARNTDYLERNANLELRDLDGNSLATAERKLLPNGRFSEFLGTLFPDVAGDLEGSVVIKGCCFAGVALELEVGTAFTTLPVSSTGDFTDRMFDLPMPARLSFVPSGVDQYGISRTSDGSLDPTFGEDLDLGDDDTTEVSFPAGFPYFGTTYESFWVNSDGNITFQSGDGSSPNLRTADRMLKGGPRISPFYADLDPRFGSVNADVRDDRAVITWLDLPQFGNLDNRSTFQAILYSDGSFEFLYDEVVHDFSNLNAVTGYRGLSGVPDVPLFWKQVPGQTIKLGALGSIYQEFGPYKKD